MAGRMRCHVCMLLLEASTSAAKPPATINIRMCGRGMPTMFSKKAESRSGPRCVLRWRHPLQSHP
jgi:hypothetical protein